MSAPRATLVPWIKLNSADGAAIPTSQMTRSSNKAS